MCTWAIHSLEPVLIISTWLQGNPALPHADGWGSLEFSHQCQFSLSAGLGQLQSVHTATAPWLLMLPCPSHSNHNHLHLQRGEEGKCDYSAVKLLLIHVHVKISERSFNQQVPWVLSDFYFFLKLPEFSLSGKNESHFVKFSLISRITGTVNTTDLF